MKTSFEIQNLKCGGCANTIRKNLTQIAGVENIEIDVEQNAVHFETASEQLINKVQDTLHKIGYPVVGAANSVLTQAKSFVSCAVGKMS
jgi:copper chaperone